MCLLLQFWLHLKSILDECASHEKAAAGLFPRTRVARDATKQIARGTACVPENIAPVLCRLLLLLGPALSKACPQQSCFLTLSPHVRESSAKHAHQVFTEAAQLCHRARRGCQCHIRRRPCAARSALIGRPGGVPNTLGRLRVHQRPCACARVWRKPGHGGAARAADRRARGCARRTRTADGTRRAVPAARRRPPQRGAGHRGRGRGLYGGAPQAGMSSLRRWVTHTDSGGPTRCDVSSCLQSLTTSLPDNALCARTPYAGAACPSPHDHVAGDAGGARAGPPLRDLCGGCQEGKRATHCHLRSPIRHIARQPRFTPPRKPTPRVHAITSQLCSGKPSGFVKTPFDIDLSLRSHQKRPKYH